MNAVRPYSSEGTAAVPRGLLPGGIVVSGIVPLAGGHKTCKKIFVFIYWEAHSILSEQDSLKPEESANVAPSGLNDKLLAEIPRGSR